MSVEHVPRKVDDLIAFHRWTREHLEKRRVTAPDVNGDEIAADFRFSRQDYVTFGGIVTGAWRSAWLINERSLEIVSTLDGTRQNVYEFGGRHRSATSSSSASSSLQMNCVVQLPRGGQVDGLYELLFGGGDNPFKGTICTFDPCRNVVSRAVGLPHSVSAVEMVSGRGGPSNVMGPMLAAHLRYMHGVVAVGTRHGTVHLVDLQLDERNLRGDESDPGQLVFIKRTGAASDVPRVRNGCVGQNKFLALTVNDDHLVGDVFTYRSSDDSFTNLTLSSGDVFVSSLHFLRQTGHLAVGFSFGGFQLWNLNTLTLEYTSPCEFGSPSVVAFAFQEPDNDPRDDCYLWVVRGHAAGDNYVPESVTNATLYCLAFGRKMWTDGIGHCYQALSSCVLRFSWTLDIEPSPVRRGNCGILGSRLVRCSTVNENPDPSCRRSSDANLASLSDREDGGSSLCMFAWETFFLDPNHPPIIVLAVFDLNQWYLTQMPAVIRCIDFNPCPYLGFFSMIEICEKAGQGTLAAIDIPVHTIYRPLALFPSEKLSYPSFLTFDVIVVFTTGIVRAKFPGLQGQAFNELMRGGTLSLVEPERAFSVLRYADLLPLHGEPLKAVVSQSDQRAVILSVALEKDLVEFLRLCVRDWAVGKNVTDGCDLRFLQTWAWTRVAFIKAYIDRHCPILYDCSGLRLESSVINCLRARVVQLKHLERLFRLVVERCPTITDQGSKELASKAKVTQLLATHLDVVVWFINFGLLPESHESDNADDDDILVYPRTAIAKGYDELRADSQKINSTIGRTDFLMIDGMLSNAGDQIVALWKDEEAAVETDGQQRHRNDGLYPPATLHALLGIFLLEGVPLSTKHCIVQYFFIDLATLLNGGPHAHVIEDLVMYPSAFRLSASLIKLTQGFWLLDHMNFEEALSVLLHPIIDRRDISPWQHRRIMKAFLYRGEAKKALRYANVRQPPQGDFEDRKFYMTLLIAAGSFTRAYFYQKEIRDQSNAECLLDHFFLGCLQTDCFRDILQLPFDSFEEECLERFLLKSLDKRCRDYLVVYFMIRSKYLEAKRLNDQLELGEKAKNPAEKERAATRKMLVDGFYRLLPKVQREMFENARSMFASGRPVKQEVRQCQPLSTRVRFNTNEPTTSTTFVAQVMESVSDLWNRPSDDYSKSPIKMPKFRSEMTALENVPFVGTPILSRAERTSSLPRAVYPTLVTKSADSTDDDRSLFYVSPRKRARFGHIVEDGTDAETLSLLQTPPVRRKTPSSRLVTPSLDVTPQSILKWRSQTSSPASALRRRQSEVAVCTLTSTPSAALNAPLKIPDDMPEVHPDTWYTTESETENPSVLTTVEPVRQLRFQPADDDDDDDDDTVTFPGIDDQSVSSESVSSDRGRSPLSKFSSQSFHRLQPFVKETHSELPIRSVADGGESMNNSCAEEEDANAKMDDDDDDDDGQQYVTPEMSSSERPVMTKSPSMSSSSSPAKIQSLSSWSPSTGSPETSPFHKSGIETSTSKSLKTSITDLKGGLTPGDIFRKFVEYRSKVLEEELASGASPAADEAVEGPPSFKSLVDTTVESLLSTPSPDEGPKFVSGVVKCDFPSRRSKSREIRRPPSSLQDDKPLAEDGSKSTITTQSSSSSSSMKIEVKHSELTIELDRLDETLVAEQMSPSSVTSTSSRRSTRSSTAMSHVSEGTGMQLRSRHPSTASSTTSPESLQQTLVQDAERRTGRSSSKAKDDVTSQTPGERPTSRNSVSAKTDRRRRSIVRKLCSEDASFTPISRASIESFLFSLPTILANDEDAAELAKSPPVSTEDASSFVFSPPLTRSRSAEARNSASKHSTVEKRKKIPSRRSSRSTTPLVSDSIVNLLSPIVELRVGAGDDDDEGSDSSTRSRTHSMTLRRGKAIIEPRSSSSLK